jgi:hypothetical protein
MIFNKLSDLDKSISQLTLLIKRKNEELKENEKGIFKLIQKLEEQKGYIVKLEAEKASLQTTESYYSRSHKLEPLRNKKKTCSIKDNSLLNIK